MTEDDLYTFGLATVCCNVSLRRSRQWAVQSDWVTGTLEGKQEACFLSDFDHQKTSTGRSPGGSVVLTAIHTWIFLSGG